jgi:hypothetical protein
MNKIRAEYRKTEFTNGEHLVMMIDDIQLDKIVSTTGNKGHITGLFSTLLNGWLDNKKESEIVWNRIELKSNEIKMVPLLMCSDDCDFSCTIIIAEMKLEKEKVYIKKLGLDETSTRHLNPNTVGRNVNWLSELGPYIFDQVEFENCIKEFKK